MSIAGLLLVTAASAAMAATKTIDYTPALRCTPFVGAKNAPTGAQQQHADALIAAFEKAYPSGLVDASRVELATIPPTTLKTIVAQLACLATHPGADPFVPDQAAALFASKRYGKTAFALLDKVGNARFATQMRRYAAIRR